MLWKKGGGKENNNGVNLENINLRYIIFSFFSFQNFYEFEFEFLRVRE